MVARFWARSGETVWLDEEGYLAEPDRYPWASSKLYGLDELASEPCLLLLGEPGIGKSTALAEYARDFTAEPVRVFQLKNFEAADLERSLFASAWFREWEANSTTLHLFLDSLDECQGRAPTVTAKIISLLGGLAPDTRARLRLRIACRTQQVPPSLMDGLMQLWSQVSSYELAPLRWQDVQVEAQRCQQPETFLRELQTCRLGPLASRPITLKFLIRMAEQGPLPSSRAEIYQRGCRQLCEEPDRDRRFLAWQRPQLDASRRLEVAEQIATAMLLSQRMGVWMGAEPAPQRDDWTVQELWQVAIRMSGLSSGLTLPQFRGHPEQPLAAV